MNNFVVQPILMSEPLGHFGRRLCRGRTHVFKCSYENSDQRKNPPVLRPGPFAKGAIGGFLPRWSRPLRLIFMRGVVPIGT
jgi:hypothetical protein